MKWLIGLMAMLSFNTFASDICLDWSSEYSYNCSGYEYKTLPVYFLDRYGVEQKFVAKKIIQKSNGEFLHANYDFEMKCTVNCNNYNAATDQYLEDWRSALINQTTYTYEIISSCTRLTCGNEEPLSVGESNDAVLYGASKAKVDLDSAESATTTISNILNIVKTGIEIKNELTKNESQSEQTRFVIVPFEEYGLVVMCELQSNGTCTPLNGEVIVSEVNNTVEAKFTDLESGSAATGVNKMLEDFFMNRNKSLQCVSSTNCWTEHDGTRTCSASFTCFL